MKGVSSSSTLTSTFRNISLLMHFLRQRFFLIKFYDSWIYIWKTHFSYFVRFCAFGGSSVTYMCSPCYVIWKSLRLSFRSSCVAKYVTWCHFWKPLLHCIEWFYFQKNEQITVDSENKKQWKWLHVQSTILDT